MSWGPAAINPEHLIAQLDYARAAKTPYEIACLREANVLGARGHVAAEHAFRGGASEFEIALAFMTACGQRERELPYNPIVALNEGGAVLHYQIQQRRAPAKLAFAAHRCRRRVRRLRLRHHAHAFVCGRRVRGHHPALRRAAARAVRAGARRSRLARFPSGLVSRDQRVPARDRRHQRERGRGHRQRADHACSTRTASATC